MRIINDDGGCRLWQPTGGRTHLAWCEGRQPLGVVLHSSNGLGELLQWLCHDDCIINIEHRLKVFIVRTLTLRDP